MTDIISSPKKEAPSKGASFFAIERFFLNPAVSLPLLLLLVGYLYSPVFEAEYVWDDKILFLESSKLRDPATFWQAIAEPVMANVYYFRPAVQATFALEFTLAGVKPALSHAINLLVHCINITLVFFLARKLLSLKRALCASIFFALNPLLIESVSWVSARFDLLCVMFSLCALNSLFCFHGWLRSFGASVFFLLALLSKEMAITLPILALIITFGMRHDSGLDPYHNKKWLEIIAQEKRSIALVTLALILYFAMRLWSFGTLGISQSAQNESFTLSEHIGIIVSTFIFYIELLVSPLPDISPLHPWNNDLVQQSVSPINVVMLFGISAIIIWSLRTQRLFGALLMCCIVSLLPVLNVFILNLAENIGHERFLVLPLVFVSLGIAALPKVSSFRDASSIAISRVVISLVIVFWMAGSSLTISSTVPLWKDNLTLWYWMHERYPENALAKISLFGEALKLNDASLADHLYQKFSTPTNEGISAGLAVQLARYQYLKGNYQQALAMIKGVESSMQWPHQSDHPRSQSDENAESKHEQAWLVVLAYQTYTEIHMAMARYDEALRATGVMLKYKPDYGVAMLYQSMAKIALNEVHAIDPAQAIIDREFNGEEKDGAYAMLNQFIGELCSTKNSIVSICMGGFESR